MKRILVIDNNKDFRNTLAAILKGAGFEALLVSSGYNGLIQAKKKSPDLILLDIRMPRMNGLMMLKKLKMDKKTAQIPVIIVTGAASGDQEEEAIRNGAALILEKPFKIEEFLSAIKKCIEK